MKKFNFVVGKKSFKNPIFKYRWYFLSERKNSILKNSLQGGANKNFAIKAVKV